MQMPYKANNYNSNWKGKNIMRTKIGQLQKQKWKHKIKYNIM